MASMTVGTRTRNRVGKPVLALAGGALLAAAVLTGVGIWQGAGRQAAGEAASTTAIGQGSPRHADASDSGRVMASTSVTSPFDTMGGVAERIAIQAELAGMAGSGEQADTMGGVAERMKLHEEMSSEAPAADFRHLRVHQSPERTTVYHASSETEATWLQRMLADLDAIRAEAGQLARNDVVIVSHSAEEGDALAGLYTKLRLPGMAVFDLRQP